MEARRPARRRAGRLTDWYDRCATFRLAAAREVFVLDRPLFNRVVGQCGAVRSMDGQLARATFRRTCRREMRGAVTPGGGSLLVGRAPTGAGSGAGLSQ